MHLMHKLMITAHRASANLHIHVPHYTHFIPFMSKKDFTLQKDIANLGLKPTGCCTSCI